MFINMEAKTGKRNRLTMAAQAQERAALAYKRLHVLRQRLRVPVQQSVRSLRTDTSPLSDACAPAHVRLQRLQGTWLAFARLPGFKPGHAMTSAVYRAVNAVHRTATLPGHILRIEMAARFAQTHGLPVNQLSKAERTS